MRIENFVTRVTVRHHKACRVMPNSYPSWRNFQFAPKNHHKFFFWHTLPSTTAFRLKFVLFYQYDHARITTFSSKKCSVRLLSQELTSKRLAHNDVKMTLKSTSWRHARCRLTPLYKTELFRTGEIRGKPCWVCKNIRILHWCEVRIENSVPRVTVWHHEALPSDAKQ